MLAYLFSRGSVGSVVEGVATSVFESFTLTNNDDTQFPREATVVINHSRKKLILGHNMQSSEGRHFFSKLIFFCVEPLPDFSSRV